MDVLDLEVRQVANLKVARWQLWLRKIRWSDDVKEQLRTAPITGNGKLCGDKMSETLEDYKLVSDHLDGADGMR